MENFNMVLLLKLINEMDYDTEASKVLLDKYGIDKKNYLKIALKEDYIKIYDIQQGTVKDLKEILKNAGLVQTGNKEILMQRVIDNIDEKELKKYFGNDKYKLTPLGRKFLKDNIEELEEVLAGNGEKENKEAVEGILAEEKIEETPIEAVEKIGVEDEIIEENSTEIKEETAKETEEIKIEVKEKIEEKVIKEEKVVEHKDKFAKNYIVVGVIIILIVVCINLFL
ncbi:MULTISPECIES: hypothetical protein [Fusobacterium]|uniref:SAP domain-containing protein n=1 Tax=Fusobacterium varium ATCC 27725 TaxID=469618 RepID=A0ABM6U659_FUSVA|nr:MULTISPECIES: hypothetical protein [Fusobacterium]AVQ31829.1 hypothetical protein C4N18_11620 [Fusobacterium varium ATCC 27725]MCF0171515.1 hypothetical protein [Fusobacterium varium]